MLSFERVDCPHFSLHFRSNNNCDNFLIVHLSIICIPFYFRVIPYPGLPPSPFPSPLHSLLWQRRHTEGVNVASFNMEGLASRWYPSTLGVCMYICTMYVCVYFYMSVFVFFVYLSLFLFLHLSKVYVCMLLEFSRSTDVLYKSFFDLQTPSRPT